MCLLFLLSSRRQGSKIAEDIGYLIGLKRELRHIGMSRDDPLGQRLLKGLEGISSLEHAKRRRLRNGALAVSAHRVQLSTTNARPRATESSPESSAHPAKTRPMPTSQTGAVPRFIAIQLAS